MAPSGAERRRVPRVSAEIDITFSSGHNFFATRTRDISTGGLFLETREPLAVGDRITICLHLLKRTFWVRSEVAWVLSSADGRVEGVGVSFLDIDDAARRTIAVFMTLRAPLQLDEILDEETTKD